MTLRELLARLRDRLRRDALARELQDELRFHQAMLERDQTLLGHDAAMARRRATLTLGHHATLTENTRDMWSLGWIDDLIDDARHGARVLRNSPTFSIAVVATIALGIGANTAIFSVVNAVLLRPLPYAEPHRLVSIWTAPTGSPGDRNPVSLPTLTDWREQNRVFTEIGGYAFNRFEVKGVAGADIIRGVLGTATLHEVIGTRPTLGRLPGRDEERAPVVAISHRLWQRRYNGDESAVGGSLILNGTPYTIIGVMPPGFHFPTPEIDLWTTLHSMTVSFPGPSNPWLTGRGMRGYRTIARLRPGVTHAAADQEMNAIMQRLGAVYPEQERGIAAHIQTIDDDTVGTVRRPLWMMLAAAGLLLLLACANVAHLMLARTSARAHEMEIRRALGAHRGRLTRQLLTESVMVGVLGGLLGIGIAFVAMRLFTSLSPDDIPRMDTVTIDLRTLLFAAAATVGTGILCGVAPAIVTWRGNATSMRMAGRAGTQGARTRSILTAAEVAFALVLLVGAGLMVRSFANLTTRDLGLDPDRVVVFGVRMPADRYQTPQARTELLNRLLSAIRANPGVEGAGASTSMPPSRTQQGNGFVIDGDAPRDEGDIPTAIFVPATPGFLATLRLPVIAGRDFGEGDALSSPRVAIVSRELARKYFGTRDPLGHHIRMQDTVWRVIGVAGDAPYHGVGSAIEPVIYVPWSQASFFAAWIAVKTTGDPAAVYPALHEAVRAADPTLVARDLRPLNEIAGETIVRPRFQAWLLTAFGGLGLLLAAVGIYGVVAYGVAQRTAEIGVRVALGAPRRAVIRLLITRGMVAVGTGVAIGLAISVAVSRVLSTLLFGVSPTDLPTFAAVSLTLLVVAVVAAYLPASRAARLDPLTALRNS